MYLFLARFGLLFFAPVGGVEPKSMEVDEVVCLWFCIELSDS